MVGGNAGIRNQLLDHTAADPAGCKDLDPAARRLVERLKHVASFPGGLFLSACKDRVVAERDDLLQCLHRIRTYIKRAVEGNLQIPGGFFKACELFRVQGAVRIQDADNNAVCAFLAEHFNFFIQFITFISVKTVVAVAGAQKHPHFQVRVSADLPEERQRRGYASDHQIAAQFHAAGAAFLSGNRGFDTVYTSFKNIVFHNRLPHFSGAGAPV